jgi:hypothetical protein
MIQIKPKVFAGKKQFEIPLTRVEMGLLQQQAKERNMTPKAYLQLVVKEGIIRNA